MEKMRFDEFLKAVEYAPITPMQALELMSIVYRYMQAVKEFHESSTPEREALARWRMRDIKEEYSTMRFLLSCGLPELYQFEKDIY
jgi:hypothetical protein